MAHKLDPMDLKQMITLHLDKESNRDISERLGIGRNTVNKYMKLFKASEIDLRELLDLDNASLQELFPLKTTINNKRYNALMKYFEKVNDARKHPGFTLLYHYLEYNNSYKDPYSQTQFMSYYRKKYPKLKGSMKLDHEAGKEVFVDFAGKRLYIIDKTTGEEIPVEVFVAILPNSQYTYVEACLSQKRADFLSCMGNALSFYGGVPKAIVSDNLKSAVSRASKYEPDINRSFKDFARHYSCVINPTRTYSPQDKALVENAVHLSYQRIYYPIREMQFFSLEELNREIRKHLEVYNDLLFQRKESSRRELFQRVERQYLKPLPSTRYEMKDYRRARVQKMGYVYFSPDKNYYSVPYRYIGEDTQIHYTKNAVEVYHRKTRIAFHRRSSGAGSYITDKNHLSSTHRAYSDWSPDYFKTMAVKHGPSVLAFVEGILRQSEYPEINYKRAMGLIQLYKSYGSERLDNACRRGLHGNSFSYRVIKNILKNRLDTEVVEADAFKKKSPIFQTTITFEENQVTSNAGKALSFIKTKILPFACLFNF